MSKKAIYVRVSSVDQNPERQTKQKGFEYFIDKITGAMPFENRPAGKKLIQAIKTGKINHVEVKSIDRLGRNAYNIQQTVEFFKLNKIQLIVADHNLQLLNEKGEENPLFKMFVDLLANIAEMERKSILERQKEGISIAKAKGIYTGRKPGTAETKKEFLHKHRKAVDLISKGLSVRLTAKACDISPATVQKIKKYMNQDPQQITLEQAIDREQNSKKQK